MTCDLHPKLNPNRNIIITANDVETLKALLIFPFVRASICGALIFSLMPAWTSYWTKSRVDGWDALLPMLRYRYGQRHFLGLDKMDSILKIFFLEIYIWYFMKNISIHGSFFPLGPIHNESSHYLSQWRPSPNRRPISKKLGLKESCSFPSGLLNNIDSDDGWLPSARQQAMTSTNISGTSSRGQWVNFRCPK